MAAPLRSGSCSRQVAFALVGASGSCRGVVAPARVSRGPAVALTAVPLTTYQGREQEPTFSPDGNSVAFAWNGEAEDNWDIYVKLIGPGPPLRLTTDPAVDVSPAWSRDGRSIAFIRALGGRATVIVLPSLGGPERQVLEFPTPTDISARSSSSVVGRQSDPRPGWIRDAWDASSVDRGGCRHRREIADHGGRARGAGRRFSAVGIARRKDTGICPEPRRPDW